MSEIMKKTIELKKAIKTYYGITEKNATDREIIDFLCLASNTYDTVQECFEKAKYSTLSLERFYTLIVGAFLERDLFPMCVERIVNSYPNKYDFALSYLLPNHRCFLNIWNDNGKVPYIDASLMKVPFNGQWGEYVNLGAIKKSEHNYVFEQLLSKLDTVQYEFAGEVKLITGKETRTISAGFYTFYYGRNWLILEWGDNK